MEKKTLQDIMVLIEEGTKAVFDSDVYRNYLKMMSRFHDYSYANTILIMSQKPDARYVAGYQTWKKVFHRNVRKGEKGIRIIAPVYNQDDEIRAFRMISVFDIDQTDGEPMPRYMLDHLIGDIDSYEEFRNALFQVAGVPIRFAPLSDCLHGYYDRTVKEITISDSLGQLQTIKTMIHEIAHSFLHEDKSAAADRNTCEVEAESVACAVCMHYGFDTTEYSFGYIAGYSKSKELMELKQSMSRIQQTADRIIRLIDMVINKEEACVSAVAKS